MRMSMCNTRYLYYTVIYTTSDDTISKITVSDIAIELLICKEIGGKLMLENLLIPENTS